MAPLSLHQAAALAGCHAWWEQRLFELAGAWSVAATDAAITVGLAEQAQAHAARAQQWHARLPVLAGWDPAALTAAPTAALPVAVATLTAQTTTPSARLVALARVLLPARLAGYQAHLERSSLVCDGPSVRVLAAAVAALPQEIERGEELLAGVAAADDDRALALAERRCRDLLHRT